MRYLYFQSKLGEDAWVYPENIAGVQLVHDTYLHVFLDNLSQPVVIVCGTPEERRETYKQVLRAMNVGDAQIELALLRDQGRQEERARNKLPD